jgi:hypothetical protein
MARPKSWNSPTAAVRIPAHAVPAVIALARQLDTEPPSEGFVQNPNPPSLITIGQGSTETRYLLQPPADISPEDSALVDELVNQFFETFPDHRDRLVAYCRSVEKCLSPIKS